MAATNAQRGYYAERRTIALLVKWCYTGVRSSRSLGPWDHVVWNNWHHRHVQTKRNCWPDRTEMERLTLSARHLPPGTIAEIWRWTPGAHEPVIRRYWPRSDSWTFRSVKGSKRDTGLDV